jgi:hypothetical protein
MKRDLYNRILQQILDRYKITKDELYESTKMHDVVNARYLLFYVCKKNGISVSRLQILLKEDGFNVTTPTVLRGIQAMENRILEDTDYISIIKSINTNQS